MKTLIADRFGCVLIAVGCTIAIASAETHVLLRPEKLAEMDTAIVQAIAEKQCSGGVLWVEHNGASHHKAFGKRALVPIEEPMTGDSIFDVASLTKVVACAPAVMLLVERGEVKLDEPARTYLPEFTGGGKESITVRQLMTHVSGLRPDVETKSDWQGQAAAIQKACEERLQSVPGTVFRYSDINFFLLGEIVQRVSKTPLEEYVQREIYSPLKMTDTGFRPSAEKLPRIAPTEVVDGKAWRGVVHDPTARKMGGVAGHAGLFTTAPDLARYAKMLLNDGELDGVRVFKPETVRLMTSVQTPPGVSARRGLGWDIDSGYSVPRGGFFPLGSFGHTGWTGASLWLDPFSKTFVIFLSNRNHPTESGNVSSLRAQLGTLAAEAVADFNFAYVPGALPTRAGDSGAQGRARHSVRAGVASFPGRRTRSHAPYPGQRVQTLNGIDVLAKNHFAPLKGKRVGLITNHTGHDGDRNATIDLLKNAPGVKLVALFSPEHGIRGVADEQVGDGKDEMTGLPIYSLYSETRKPKPEHLKDLDVLVFDIQDIGCRFYTYASTMGLAMEAASENGKQIFILDRVNPINGVAIDGPVLAGPPTFVGFYKVPLRHGMTLGELARMYNAEQNLKADLTVIEIENWRRDQWFDETGLPWTSPSPNLRNLKQAMLYPGVGLLESALSVGRGTDTPFEVVGAPYIDD
ncbi:MAG: exo-beta-N-acetylmuramidase NamZ domain-containing protein, partial [Verrucomicrobiota bacterium]